MTIDGQILLPPNYDFTGTAELTVNKDKIEVNESPAQIKQLTDQWIIEGEDKSISGSKMYLLKSTSEIF